MKETQEVIKMRYKNCLFCSKSHERTICRCHPPVVNDGGSGIFPSVEPEYDYCGEFANSIAERYGGVISFENTTKVFISRIFVKNHNIR